MRPDEEDEEKDDQEDDEDVEEEKKTREGGKEGQTKRSVCERECTRNGKKVNDGNMKVERLQKGESVSPPWKLSNGFHRAWVGGLRLR